MPAIGRPEKGLCRPLASARRTRSKQPMPELPEVETMMRGLRPVLEGRRITSVELRRSGLRFPFPADFARRLEGRRIESLARRAKYIVAAVEGGDNLLIHLGMTGRFTVLTNEDTRNLGEFYFESGASEAGNGPHDHVAFTLENQTRVIYNNQNYPVTALENGDEVVARIQDAGNGSYYTDSITVTQSANNGGGGSNPSGVRSYQGTVRQVDRQSGRFSINNGAGYDIIVSMPYNPSEADRYRFERLARGQAVRFYGVPISTERIELRQFY